MKQRVCKDDQIKLIMECRQSGLSDYQWCEKTGFIPVTSTTGLVNFVSPAILFRNLRQEQMHFQTFRK